MTGGLHLLMAGLLASGPGQASTTSSPIQLGPQDRVEVTEDGRRIRGRVSEITADTIVIYSMGTRVDIPLTSVTRIDRFGESKKDGAAIGFGAGAALSFVALAKICANTNCSDLSSNIDPRFTLAVGLLGAGIGAIVDGLIDGRKTIYRAGTGQRLEPGKPRPIPSVRPSRSDAMLFGRIGRGGISDDEGSIGSGATLGAGLLIPVSRRMAVQLEYDRHARQRNFEFNRTFSGTEQLATVKALYFFRPDRAARPYVGIGFGAIDSRSRSESPTLILGPGLIVTQGPLEIHRKHSTGGTFGVGMGLEGQIGTRLSVLTDLTFDLGHPNALASTRLTVGAGWRF
jgi:hypothetical protein